MEKTAIDWLIDQLEKYELYSKISFQCLKEIEEAKERDSLEKINNFNDGWMHCEKWFEEKELDDVSDDVLFQQATVAMEKHYGYGCETEIDAYFRGAKWMQKQLNKAQK